MKKLLSFMAIAAMLMVSCNKPNNGDDPDNGNEETEYKAPITIDGDFADWSALGDKVQLVKCASTAAKTDLKLAKVYADKYYVFVYVEFDFSAYDAVTDAHFDFYINGDNDTSTGGYKGAFDQGETPCVDLLMQGDVISGGVVCENYDPFVGSYSGTTNSADWGWTEIEGLTGFVSGKGTKKAFEFALTRELYPLGKLAKEFTMGMDILVNGWDATGALPNTEATETNPSGEANLLLVKYNK